MSRGYPLVTGQSAVDAGPLSDWNSFTPTITIVGAGAAPNYVTNQARFRISVSNTVYVDVYLNGDGGTPGSGAGQLALLLPVVPAPSILGGYILAGYCINNVKSTVLYCNMTAVPSLLLSILDKTDTLAPLTGADQNNANRQIRMHLWYETYQLPPV